MPSAFCLVVVQALACFGLSTFEHETLFWLDFVVLVPTLLPLLYILLQVRRRRQLDRNSINNHHTSVRQVVPSALRVPVGAFAFAGICIVLAAGLNAASRLSNEADNLRPKRTMKLDRGAGALSILYTLGIFIVLAFETLAQTASNALRTSFIGFLSIVAIGQSIAQAVALSTSRNNRETGFIQFTSSTDIGSFLDSSRASLSLAIIYVASILLLALRFRRYRSVPRTLYIILACAILAIQFGISFLQPGFSQLLARKILALFAFVTLSLELTVSLAGKGAASDNMQDIGFEKANRLSGNAGRAKPDMTIKTDLPGFPVAPLGRGPFDSATTLASGRATVYQRSITSAPQIAYTPAKGHRPLTSSDYDAVTDRRSYRASQLSSLSGSQYVAYGLAAEPSSRRSSMASFSTASSSGSSKNSQSAMLPDDNSHRNSQSDILSHAFQGERSPGSTATGHSMAEVRTAQVIPARSDSTKSNNTQATSIVTMDEVRRRIELGDRVARTDTVSVDAARLARRSSSSKGQTVGKAVGEGIQDSSSVDIAEPQAPAATAQLQNPRQKSLYAAIESTPKTPPPPMPLPRTPRPISSAQPSANSEAWWMRLSAIRESKSDVPSRPSRSPESSRASSGGSSVSTRHGFRAGYRDQ